MKKWKMRNGQRIEVSEMTDHHLKAAYKMLKRQGFVSLNSIKFYLSCKVPNGEMAQDAFYSELNDVMSSPVSAFVDIFEKEAKERNLSLNA